MSNKRKLPGVVKQLQNAPNQPDRSESSIGIQNTVKITIRLLYPAKVIESIGRLGNHSSRGGACSGMTYLQAIYESPFFWLAIDKLNAYKPASVKELYDILHMVLKEKGTTAKELLYLWIWLFYGLCFFIEGFRAALLTSNETTGLRRPLELLSWGSLADQRQLTYDMIKSFHGEVTKSTLI